MSSSEVTCAKQNNLFALKTCQRRDCYENNAYKIFHSESVQFAFLFTVQL